MTDPQESTDATHPLVSVVIATYELAQHLPETLASVFAQTHPNVEVIVVDDGSTDDTLAVLHTYGSTITVVARAHEGLGPTRDAGLQLAAGEYVLFLDADDILEPDAITIQVEFARRNPSSGLVIGDGTVFEDPAQAGNGLYPDRIKALLREAGGAFTGDLYGLFIGECPARCPAQALLSRAAVDRVGSVCTTPNGAQDYDYYLRVARQFPVTAHTARVVRYRVREESMSGPYAGRTLLFSAQAIELLERERGCCAPSWRAPLDDEMRRRALVGLRAAALQLADTGQRPDPDRLRTLRRHLSPAGRSAAFALASVPPRLGRAVLATARRARRR